MSKYHNSRRETPAKTCWNVDPATAEPGSYRGSRAAFLWGIGDRMPTQPNSSTLWSIRRFRRVATRHRTVAIYMGSSPSLFPVRATGLDYTMEHPAETPGGNSPPDCCIYMGSCPSLFPVRATGLEPARLSQRNLNPPSLPIPPRPHVACNRVILSWEPGNVNGRQSEPLKFPGGKGQFSQFLLSLSLTFRQGACKIS